MLVVDIDKYLIEIAKAIHPGYKFVVDLPKPAQKFDTIFALALVEHLDDAGSFLCDLRERMSSSDMSKIVITTPNPVFQGLHKFVPEPGIFSKHASEEHKTFLNYEELAHIAKQCNLIFQKSNHFLMVRKS